jgi:hypothetical protein
MRHSKPGIDDVTLVLPLVVSYHRIQPVRVQCFLLPFISSAMAYCLLDGVLKVPLTFSNTYWLSGFSIVWTCRQCVRWRCCRRWIGDGLPFYACATQTTGIGDVTLVLPLVVSYHRIQDVRMQCFVLPFI